MRIGDFHKTLRQASLISKQKIGRNKGIKRQWRSVKRQEAEKRNEQ